MLSCILSDVAGDQDESSPRSSTKSISTTSNKKCNCSTCDDEEEDSCESSSDCSSPEKKKSAGRKSQRSNPMKQGSRNKTLDCKAKLCRFTWAKKHGTWKEKAWYNVLFTDEARYYLDSNEGVVGLAYSFSSTKSFQKNEIRVWTAISWNMRFPLIILKHKTATASSFKHFLEKHIVTHLECAGNKNIILQFDNAAHRRSNLVINYLCEKDIKIMDWPSQSHDLNPLNYMWKALRKVIMTRNPKPSSLRELTRALKEEWDCLPVEFLRDLITRMPKKVRAVVASEGDIVG